MIKTCIQENRTDPEAWKTIFRKRLHRFFFLHSELTTQPSPPLPLHRVCITRWQALTRIPIRLKYGNDLPNNFDICTQANYRITCLELPRKKGNRTQWRREGVVLYALLQTCVRTFTVTTYINIQSINHLLSWVLDTEDCFCLATFSRSTALTWRLPTLFVLQLHSLHSSSYKLTLPSSIPTNILLLLLSRLYYLNIW